MASEFESDNWNVKYISEDNVVCLTWKNNISGDDFRTALMHAAELIRQNDDSVLVIDRILFSDASDKDQLWVKKIYIPNLKKAECKRVIFVVKDDDISSKNDKYPYSVFSDKFRIDKVLNYDEALKVLGKNLKASPEILKMTKEEAILYMGLKEDANDYFIDEKFWQLSKNLRLENGPDTEQKIIDLSAAYNIATGRRDEEEKKKQIHDNAKKYFGKTEDEWINHFRYNWYKYVIAVVLVIVAASLINSFLFGKAECSVVSVGHFSYEGEYYEKFYESKGFKNPYIVATDVVVPNEAGEIENIYSEQSSSVLLGYASNLIVTDEMSYKYYFGNMMDMKDTYDYLKLNLSEDVMNLLVPVYCSKRECQELSQEYLKQNHMLEEEDDLTQYSDERVMVGFMIKDKEIISKLGYNILWPEEYSEPNLIFSISSATDDYRESQEMLIMLFESFR